MDLDAYDENRATLARRAGGKAIRVASKSLRCRPLLERLLAGEDGAFRGVLALTVDEALWLSDHGVRDVVVGYPSVNRAALSAAATRASSGTPEEKIAVMVDAVEHLEPARVAGGRDERVHRGRRRAVAVRWARAGRAAALAAAHARAGSRVRA